jgi:hypothetical protein
MIELGVTDAERQAAVYSMTPDPVEGVKATLIVSIPGVAAIFVGPSALHYRWTLQPMCWRSQALEDHPPAH